MSLETLLPPVRRALEDAGLFRPGARLLCAVSGGADSVALLHALCALRAEGGFWLEASHVQHGLRGESSQEDERFVRALCRGLGTPLHVRNAGLCGGMDSPGGRGVRARPGPGGGEACAWAHRGGGRRHGPPGGGEARTRPAAQHLP